MRTRLYAAGVALAWAGIGAADDNEPQVVTRVAESRAVTLIDLEAKDKPIAEVLEDIAKKMGYDKIVESEKATLGLKGSFSFKKKPAWECVVEICERNGLVFGGAGIGADYALGIYRARGKWVAKPCGGHVAVFGQAPVGAAFDDPLRRPYALRVFTEPQVGCSFRQVAVVDQKNGACKPCDLVGLELVPTGVQEKAGKDQANPWPGLSAFTVKGTVEVVKKKLNAEVSGLSMEVAAYHVKHEGKALFTIERIAEEGNFVKIEIAAPSVSKEGGVMQGGWGHPTGPSLEAALGFRMDFADAAGVAVGATVVQWKGDGTNATVTFKFSRHILGKAGGIGALRGTFSNPLEKSSEAFSMAFQDLLK